MVQLKILSGKNNGAIHRIGRFPCHIGRSSASELRLEEPGVWDRHLELDFKPGEGVIMRVLSGALATVNGQATERALLRNGDLIEFGGSKVQFWLSATHQRSFRAREILTWVFFGLLAVVEIALVYQFLQ